MLGMLVSVLGPDAPIYRVFFFNDTATTEIYTLSLHDALPISPRAWRARCPACPGRPSSSARWRRRDRKSTRLNSSHSQISYAVFCLKKKITDQGFVLLHDLVGLGVVPRGEQASGGSAVSLHHR